MRYEKTTVRVRSVVDGVVVLDVEHEYDTGVVESERTLRAGESACVREAPKEE